MPTTLHQTPGGNPTADQRPPQQTLASGPPTVTLLDRVMPAWEATRAEHCLIDASAPQVYDAALHADFIDAVRQHRAVRVLFAVRTGVERLIAAVRRRPWVAPPPRVRLRLADLATRGEWIRLGEDPPREIVFGAIGRFWAGETRWLTIDRTAFAAFNNEGFAKIACHVLAQALPDGRTRLTYEVRTWATDPASARAFRRYWRVTSPFIGVVMRAFLTLVAREAAWYRNRATAQGPS